MIVRLAWKNIWRNKLRSIVVIIAILLGMWAGTFIMGFYKGMMNQRIDTVIKDEVSHLQFHNPEYEAIDIGKIKYPLVNEKKITDYIQHNDKVKGYSSRVLINGVMSSPHAIGGVKVLGIDPKNENALTHIGEKLIEGNFFEKNSRKIPVVISQKQADKFHLKLKSKPIISFTNSKDEQHTLGLTVVGIYKTSNGMLDERNIYIPKDRLQHIPGGDIAHEIAVLFTTNDMVNDQLIQFRKDFPEQSVKTWMDISPGMKMMVDSMDTSLYVIVIIIMLALIFGIINTMLMAVLERTREFGMLMAIGMNKLKVFALVLLETLFLTLIGGPLGILVGYLTIHSFGQVGIDLGVFGKGMESMGFATIVYPQLESEKYIEIAILIFCFSIFAAIYPAIKALQLEPVKAIRKI